MIINGWISGIERITGPSGKVNGGTNPVEGVVLHSAEGYKSGLLSQIMHGQVSWHFTILKDGHIWQHYQLSAQCWHSASWGNNRLIGIEHEGIIGEALTPEQLRSSISLCREIFREYHLLPSRRVTLWEHRELGSTSCPNGRIPWLAVIAGLLDDSEPEDEEEGGDMVIISKRKVFPENARDGTDWFKSYLVTGRTFRHIPSAAAYDSLRAMGLDDFEPDAVAWDFLAADATFIE